jgi:hypothetical protein
MWQNANKYILFMQMLASGNPVLQKSDAFVPFHEKGYSPCTQITGGHFGKHALLKEEERCNQRVMPNCGGVPSTPFFSL